jgi:hypothetical protein
MKAIYLKYRENAVKLSGYLNKAWELTDQPTEAARFDEEEIGEIITVIETQYLLAIDIQDIDLTFWTPEEYGDACTELADTFQEQWVDNMRIDYEGAHFALVRTPTQLIQALQWTVDGYRPVSGIRPVYENVAEACKELAIYAICLGDKEEDQ